MTADKDTRASEKGSEESSDVPEALTRMIERQLTDVEDRMNTHLFDAIASLGENPLPDQDALEQLHVDAARLQDLVDDLTQLRYQLEEAEE